MIKVFFPQGCYGTFLTRCLYHFSSLNVDVKSKQRLTFDEHGSSHVHRKNKKAKDSIVCGHLDTLDFNKFDDIVTLLPCNQHQLDYFDNQFVKQEQSKIISYINTMIEPTEIKQKLATSWQYHEPFDENVPRWMLREWCSFWLVDCLKESYNRIPYQQLNSRYQTDTMALFDDLEKILQEIGQVLNLKIINLEFIRIAHRDFVANQKYHGIQTRCERWVDHLIDTSDNVDNPCATLFDEAYVQHLLRTKGYEIKCDGLDQYPTNTTEMRNLIYHV